MRHIFKSLRLFQVRSSIVTDSEHRLVINMRMLKYIVIAICIEFELDEGKDDSQEKPGAALQEATKKLHKVRMDQLGKCGLKHCMRLASIH